MSVSYYRLIFQDTTFYAFYVKKLLCSMNSLFFFS